MLAIRAGNCKRFRGFACLSGPESQLSLNLVELDSSKIVSWSYSIRTVCFVAQRANRELKERKYLLQDVMNSNGEFDASPDKTHLSDTTISKAFVLTPVV